MLLRLLKSKIHGAKVTKANLRYVGSITIDKDLMDAAGLLDNEIVMVADLDTGTRLTTYAIPGQRGSRVIEINGAAAKLVNEGDTVLIFAFAYLTPEEAARHKATTLVMGENNEVKETLRR